MGNDEWSLDVDAKAQASISLFRHSPFTGANDEKVG
jgi:hypothetical protein